MVCSHDPIFRTNKESSIWRQNDPGGYHAKFVGAFHLSRRVSDENRACSISIRFLNITDPCVERSLSVCSHVFKDPIFGTNKNRILKNGSCERALIPILCFTEVESFLTSTEAIWELSYFGHLFVADCIAYVHGRMVI